MIPARLKIAVLIWDFVTTGGAERYAWEVTHRLAREHDVHVFCQNWDPAVDGTITIHRIPNPIIKPSFLRQLLFAFFTRRALDDSFDIIHTHDPVTRFDLLTVHCPCYRGFITAQRARIKRFFVWLSVITSPRSLSYLWIERKQFTVRPDRRFLVVSETVQRDVQLNYGVPDTMFSRAYPGVDYERIVQILRTVDRQALRYAHGFQREDTVILFVGTEFKRKGLDTLLSALQYIPRSNVKLLVAGGGGGLLERYLDKVTAMGLAKRVRFTGLVEDVFSLYAAADMFVLPTLSDPCPMAPLEAMACGLPVIMSSMPYCGTAEHVQDGEAILLADPRDPEMLAAAIQGCLDEAVRRALIAKGRALAGRLSWEETTRQTLDAYRALLANREKER